MKTFAREADGEGKGKFKYENEGGVHYYENMLIQNYPRGRIVMFGNSDAICTG